MVDQVRIYHYQPAATDLGFEDYAHSHIGKRITYGLNEGLKVGWHIVEQDRIRTVYYLPPLQIAMEGCGEVTEHGTLGPDEQSVGLRGILAHPKRIPEYRLERLADASAVVDLIVADKQDLAALFQYLLSLGIGHAGNIHLACIQIGLGRLYPEVPGVTVLAYLQTELQLGGFGQTELR